MALARVKVWNPGDVLTASDLNGEFNNILNNPISLISPTTGVITFTTAQTFPGNQVVSSSGAELAFANASRVRGLIGTMSSQSGTFAADAYVMQTTDNRRTWSVNATSQYSASVGTAGPTAGGRDIAAAFASTYIHWYAITTGPNSTAPTAIVSTATPPTGPVMPTSYSGWTYLGGSVYTSASTTVLAPHRFRGAEAAYDQSQTVLTNGEAAVETAVSVSSMIPPNSLRFGLRTQYLTARPDVQTVSFRYQTAFDYEINVLSGSGVASLVTKHISFPNASNQFLYLVSSSFAAAADGVQAKVQTYTMPNGGE